MAAIDIVFDGPPGPESGRFVEVENTEGRSIKFGEWVHRADGYWVLRIEQGSLPVAGYTDQPDEKVALVNEFKADEERLLRKLDKYFGAVERASSGDVIVDSILSMPIVDMRWVAIARTHFQEGFMALNRAVFQPQRIKLPEDEPTFAEAAERADLP